VHSGTLAQGRFLWREASLPRMIRSVKMRLAHVQQLVVAAYVVLAATPLALAATDHRFWERAHSIAPVASVIFLVVLAALATGRRSAWFLLLVFEGFVLMSFAWNFTSIVSLVLVLLSFLLLISPPMRSHVRKGTLHTA
jgi:hypothetical protein